MSIDYTTEWVVGFALGIEVNYRDGVTIIAVHAGIVRFALWFSF